jgi:3-hydroxy-9,10-secoandrosta-1,3,5(10)-triene-9,17-dione monooxygenase reductase component
MSGDLPGANERGELVMADGATAATPYGPDRPSSDQDEAASKPARHLASASEGRPDAGPDREAAPNTDERVAAIDSGRRFRAILGHFATGVVAITAIDPANGRPVGLAANSFTSVSLDPPLVSFCVAHTSTTWPRLRTADRYCVNILSAPQREVCLRFATKGTDRFAGLDWTESPGGGPVIDGALAWLECSVEAEYTAGDHVIVVARVHHLDRHHDGDPLIFYRGSYGRFDG